MFADSQWDKVRRRANFVMTNALRNAAVRAPISDESVAVLEVGTDSLGWWLCALGLCGL